MKIYPRMLLNSAFRVSKNILWQWTHSLVHRILKDTPVFDIERLSWKTVAIVWNAPFSQKFWQEIDAHDVVIRCNKWIVSPYIEPDVVGTKTDICLVWGISVLLNRKVSKIIDTHTNIQLLTPYSLDEKEVAMNALIAKLQFRDRLNFLSCETMDPVLSITPLGFRPSTGFVAMNLAIQTNTQAVNMYWFTFSDFNRIDHRSNQSVCHDFHHEKKMVLTLEEHGILSVCR